MRSCLLETMKPDGLQLLHDLGSSGGGADEMEAYHG